jgi:hypothetical protein
MPGSGLSGDGRQRGRPGLRIIVGKSEDADFSRERFGGGAGGVNPAAVIASRTRGVASRASSRSSKDFIRFPNVGFRPCVMPATLRAPMRASLGSSLCYSPPRCDEIPSQRVGQRLGAIEAALRPKTPWCVCLHLHHHRVFAPLPAGVDVKRARSPRLRLSGLLADKSATAECSVIHQIDKAHVAFIKRIMPSWCTGRLCLFAELSVHSEPLLEYGTPIGG